MSTPFLMRAGDEARARVRAAREREQQAGDGRSLAERVREMPPAPSLAAALSDFGLSVIAEIKRASPSRGDIAAIPDAAALAQDYERGGAAAISVLTEPQHFKGSPEDLRSVSTAVTAPTLRKDFIVDEHQLLEARLWGAAAALLIVALLDDPELVRLLRSAHEIGLDTLVETHTEDEVSRAVSAHATADTDRPLILGVNARDLHTLEVDLGVFERVASQRPDGAIVVAESGIKGPADAARMQALGADAVLVGEHVAMAPDPAVAVAALRTAAFASPDNIAVEAS